MNIQPVAGGHIENECRHNMETKWNKVLCNVSIITNVVMRNPFMKSVLLLEGYKR